MTDGDESARLAGRKIFDHPITHIGYAVPSIEEAVEGWATAFGVGPFYALHGIEFDRIEHRGGPAVFEHDTAFARWGDISVELWEVHRFEPAAALSPRFAPSNYPTHIGYYVDDVPEEGARLEQLGFPELLQLEIGPMEERLHDAPELGHLVEIQPGSDLLREFHAELAAKAVGWDGTDPLRSATELDSLRDSGIG